MRVFLLVLLLTACASKPVVEETASLTTFHRLALISDTARQLAVVLPPAKTTILLGEQADPFITLLSQRLRAEGFAVRTDTSAGLSYTLTEIGDITHLVLRTPTTTLARSYRISGQAIEPRGRWSVMRSEDE